MKATGLSRVSKELTIAEIEKEAKAHPAFFIAQHGAGLSAVTVDKLRAKLRQTHSRYRVVKNSLGAKAFERAGLGNLASFAGTCGIAFVGGDPAASSKVLVEFGKENESFKIQTGYMNGRALSVDQIRALASLPSKDVLIARVVGGMQAPLSRFVNVLSGTMRKVVTVFDAIAKKKG